MKKRRDSILISCTNLVLPILLTLGLYIIIHGHLSPGGGFQGGVLIAGAIAIIYIGYGFKGVNKGIAANTFKIAEDIGALGFIILAFIGLIGSGVFFGNILEKGSHGLSVNDITSDTPENLDLRAPSSPDNYNDWVGQVFTWLSERGFKVIS